VNRMLNPYRTYDGKCETYGSEMYCCSFKVMHDIVSSTLDANGIKYEYHDIDNFPKLSQMPIPDEMNKPSVHCNDNLELVKSIVKLTEKIKLSKKLTVNDFKMVNQLEWVYDHVSHHDEKHRCLLCNRPVKKTCFEVYNIEWDIIAYCGSNCVKDIETMTYKHDNVVKTLKEFDDHADTILMGSTPNIKQIGDNILQYVYSYLLNTEIEMPKFKLDVAFKIIDNVDKYHPRGLECATMCWMYSKNYTYVKYDDLKTQINIWNAQCSKIWYIEQLRIYLDDHDEHLTYASGVFMFKKYHDMERIVYETIKGMKSVIVEPIDKDTLHNFKNQYRYDSRKTYAHNHKIVDIDLIEMDPIDNQVNSFDMVNNNAISVLTGGGGCGKTHTAVAIATLMRQSGYTVVQIAPTGKAVDVIRRNNGEFVNTLVFTIHNMLYGAGHEYHYNWGKVKLYISVDECSMIDTELWHDLLLFIRRYTHVKVLLIGDVNQIAPVRFGDITADIFSMCDTMKLTSSMRTLDSGVVNCYKQRLINNEIEYVSQLMRDKPDHMKWYKYSKKGVKRYAPDHQFITHVGEDVDDINKLITGKDGIQRVDVGDKIMILKNGYEGKKMIYYNGQSGVVNEVYKEDGKIIGFDIDGEQIRFTKQHRKMKLKYLVCFANCITIHKSQGDEYKNVCIVLKGDRNIDKRLLYTALTRRKSNVVILCDGRFASSDDKINLVSHTQSYMKYFLRGTEHVDKQHELKVMRDKLIAMFRPRRWSMYSTIYKLTICEPLQKWDLDRITNKDIVYGKTIQLFKVMYSKYEKLSKK